MELIDKHSQIQNKEDLAQFIGILKDDLIKNTSLWENNDLESFLEAMQSWVEAMEWYYENHNRELPDPPTWQVFGDILMGARIYE